MKIVHSGNNDGKSKQLGLIGNYTFLRMTTIIPAWKHAVDGDANRWAVRYKKELLEAFYEEGIDSEEDINRGLSELRKSGSAFMPNPGKFAAMCKPFVIPAMYRRHVKQIPNGTVSSKKNNQKQIRAILELLGG